MRELELFELGNKKLPHFSTGTIITNRHKGVTCEGTLTREDKRYFFLYNISLI